MAESLVDQIKRNYTYRTGGRIPSQKQIDDIRNMIRNSIPTGSVTDAQLTQYIDNSRFADGDFTHTEIQDIYKYITHGTKTLSYAQLDEIANSADVNNWTRAELTQHLTDTADKAPASTSTPTTSTETAEDRVKRLYTYMTGGRAPSAEQIASLAGQANLLTDEQLIPVIRAKATADGDYHFNDIKAIYTKVTGKELTDTNTLQTFADTADAQNMSEAQLENYIKSQALGAGTLAPDLQIPTDAASEEAARKTIRESWAYVTNNRPLEKSTEDAIFGDLKNANTTGSQLVTTVNRYAEVNGVYHTDRIKQMYANLTGGAQLTDGSAKAIADVADKNNWQVDSLAKAFQDGSLKEVIAVVPGTGGGDSLEKRLTDMFMYVTGGLKPSPDMMTEMLNRGLANNATDAMLIETAKDVAHANGYYHINELLDFYSKITNGAPVSEATRAYLAQVQQDAVNEGYGFRVVRQGVKAAAVSAGVPFDESLLNDGINGNGDIWGGNWTQDRVNEIYKEITGGKEIAPAILPRYEFSPDTSESIVRDSLRRLAIASGQYHPDEIKAVYASLTNGAVISEQDLALAREAADQLNYDRAQLQSYLRGVATDNHQLAATSEINNLTYEQLRNMYLEMTDTTWGENDLTLHDKFDAGAFNGLTVEEVKTKLSDMAFNNGHYSIKFVEDAYVNLTGQQPSEETIRSIRYAADLRNAGPNRLNDIIREYAIAAGDMNGDGTVLPPETLPPAAGGGAAGGTGSSSGGAGTSGTPTSSANHQYKLISGNGPALGEGQLRGNGNAVFLVSSSGELFHVTPQLATRMQEQGLWYTPEEVPQSQVDGMNLRGSLQYVEEFGILNIPPSGQYLLVKGDGPALSTSQLSGNGDAVYAIDRNGNKYHVTGAVAEQMQKAGTWMTPAVLNQGTVDSIDLRGALASASGGVVGLTVPVGDPTVVNVVGSTVSSSGVSFKLVRGDGPNLGTSQLKGNGAAVYAVFDNGRKLHVTAAMAEQIVKEGKWVEPTIVNQAELDSTPPMGALASLSGDYRPLEILFEAPSASAGASTPTTTPASSSFKLVRGNGPNMGTKQLIGNGAAVYAVFDDGSKKLHVTAAMAEQLVKDGKWQEPAVIDQKELDSTPVGGTLADTSGKVGVLEVPLVEATPLPSSNDTRHMETMPVILPDDPTETAPSVPSTPKPAWQPDPVVDRTGEERDLMDPKYGYDMNERIEIKNHVYQGGGTFEELDQIAAIYDSGDAQRIDDWERFSQTGKYAPGAIAAVATPAPAPSTPVNNFKLVRGNGPGLGNSQLMGNGAAVYAIFDDGRKLHVTGAMAGELQRQGRWTEPEIWDQASLDQTPPAGTLADVNGAVGALEVQWLPPAPAVAEPPAPAPVAAPAAPVIEMLADRTGAQKPLNSLSAADIAHINGGGTFQEIDQVAAIYASGDKTAIENWERFTLTGKFAPTSAYGMEYQKAISEGIDPATATYWCNSKFGFI